MKILITGINGQVGYALMKQLAKHELVGLNRNDCDLANLDQIKQAIDHYRPNLIINPAAYTQVDQAEDEPEIAFLINCDAPRVMAEQASKLKIPFIHFSTDYVFDGKKDGSYHEDDLTNPLGIYGESKLAGELAVNKVGGLNYIIRTSWVYSNYGQNFYLTIKRLSHERDSLNVVEDQIASPTSSLFIAEKIQEIIPKLDQANTGIYHLVPDGFSSRYDFAKAIISQTNPHFKIENLLPIQSHEFPMKSKRPLNSVLANSKIKKIFNLQVNDWSTELDRVRDES
jgi:dTDP-4-dehydrorhamnose reductase